MVPSTISAATSLASIRSDSLASIQAVEDLLIPRLSLSRTSSCQTVHAPSHKTSFPDASHATDASRATNRSPVTDSPSTTDSPSATDSPPATDAPLLITFDTNMRVLASARWVSENELEDVRGEAGLLGVNEYSEQLAAYKGLLDSARRRARAADDNDEYMADDATEMADDVTEPISDVATEPFSDIATDPLSDVAIQPFSNVVTQPLSDATTELDAMEEGTDDTTYLTLADDYSMSPTYAPMDTDTDEDTERERILSSPAALQWRKLRAQYSLRRTYMTQNLREVPRAGPSIQEEDEGTEAHPYIEPLASGACPECGQLCETKKEWIDHAWCYNIEHNIDIDSD